jgi:hypothetical protein
MAKRLSYSYGSAQDRSEIVKFNNVSDPELGLMAVEHRLELEASTVLATLLRIRQAAPVPIRPVFTAHRRCLPTKSAATLATVSPVVTPAQVAPGSIHLVTPYADPLLPTPPLLQSTVVPSLDKCPQYCVGSGIHLISDYMQSQLQPNIDVHPFYMRRGQFAPPTTTTPLGFTTPIAMSLLEHSIRKCEGRSCGNRQVAMIAITELLSGVISDTNCYREPTGPSRDEQWARRTVASSALGQLVTIAVDNVACNPPLILALLNFLAPCIMPIDMRYRSEKLVEASSWNPSISSVQNRHYFVNTAGGFDGFLAPLLQLTSQLACSGKFNPSHIADIYAPENYPVFVKWFTKTNPPGTPVPPTVDPSVELSIDTATFMVAKSDHALFAYCRLATTAMAKANQKTILKAITYRHPQILVLCRFAVLYSNNFHIFVTCAVFWCVHSVDLQEAHKKAGLTQYCVTQLHQNSFIARASWLIPMSTELFNFIPAVGDDGSGAVMPAVTQKEAIALRLGFYDLMLTPDSIIYDIAARFPDRKKYNKESMLAHSRFGLETPLFGAIDPRFFVHRSSDRDHATEARNSGKNPANAIVVVD